jgi:CheY-like chemotaxis protein
MVESAAAHILILDEDPDSLTELHRILGKDEYHRILHNSPTAALEFLALNHVDLILLSASLKEMDSLEVCRIINHSSFTADVPMVLIMQDSNVDMIVPAYNEGVRDYILYPFNPLEVKTRIHTQLQFHDIKSECHALLNILCQDMANPISSTIASLELLHNDFGLYNELKPLLISSLDDSLNTVNVVKQILSLANRKFELEALDLASLVKEAIRILQPDLDKKHIEITVDIPEGWAVYAERNSLVQYVLLNILGNAIKFSYRDSVIEINADYEDNHTVLIIKDYGIGIPETIQPIIYDINKMRKQEGTDGEKGVGLGLPLVKRLMRAYKGSISITSLRAISENKHRGTVVKLRFNRAHFSQVQKSKVILSDTV